MIPLSDRVFFRNNFLLSTISFFDPSFRFSLRISGRLQTRRTPYLQGAHPQDWKQNILCSLPFSIGISFPVFGLTLANNYLSKRTHTGEEKYLLTWRRFTDWVGVLIPLSVSVFFQNQFLIRIAFFDPLFSLPSFPDLSSFPHLFRS